MVIAIHQGSWDAALKNYHCLKGQRSAPSHENKNFYFRTETPLLNQKIISFYFFLTNVRLSMWNDCSRLLLRSFVVY